MDRQISTFQKKDLSVRVPLTEEEQKKFRNYVQENSLHVGRFVRRLIIEKMNEKEAVNG